MNTYDHRQNKLLNKSNYLKESFQYFTICVKNKLSVNIRMKQDTNHKTFNDLQTLCSMIFGYNNCMIMLHYEFYCERMPAYIRTN